ncbi:general odorant-binding protein 19d [Tribolium castaneum]|uniref:Odorant binding protein 13 n=1 Tax=Tribolium castaneum TaxID=7070 RepID=D2A1G5_TRICA|nr:odorant binding protein 13 [Tribolium castaneum]
MKFLLVFLSVAILCTFAMDESFLQQTRDRVKAIVKECVTEEKATDSDFDDIMALKIPTSHEGKCVFFCSHKKFNMQHPDGSINKEGALDTFEVVKDVDAEFHDKVITVYNHCLSTPVDPDPCVYSVNLFQCFMKEAKAAGIHELIIK